MNYRTQCRQVNSKNSSKISSTRTQVQSVSIDNLQQSEKTFFSLNTGKKDTRNITDQTPASEFSPTSSLQRSENAISSTRRSEAIIRSCLQALLYYTEVIFLAKRAKQMNDTITHYI